MGGGWRKEMCAGLRLRAQLRQPRPLRRSPPEPQRRRAQWLHRLDRLGGRPRLERLDDPLEQLVDFDVPVGPRIARSIGVGETPTHYARPVDRDDLRARLAHVHDGDGRVAIHRRSLQALARGIGPVIRPPPHACLAPRRERPTARRSEESGSFPTPRPSRNSRSRLR